MRAIYYYTGTTKIWFEVGFHLAQLKFRALMATWWPQVAPDWALATYFCVIFGLCLGGKDTKQLSYRLVLGRPNWQKLAFWKDNSIKSWKRCSRLL